MTTDSVTTVTDLTPTSTSVIPTTERTAPPEQRPPDLGELVGFGVTVVLLSA